ncbi:MAG TPA: DoxX family membrane protein [Silvibacterium sp.]|jgi:thiosulfate dehydrogenase [quinone] large subunit|nr:DoxX family membrane protein [Silvibacterium sp.]
MQTVVDARNESLAYALLRLIVGMNMTMHGVSRLTAGPAQFAAKMTTQFSHSPLPSWSVWAFAMAVPPIEGLLGFLLLIGLRTRAALIAGLVWVLVLTFGSSLIQDWQAAQAQLTYALAYAALLFLLRFNAWSVDGWMDAAELIA